MTLTFKLDLDRMKLNWCARDIYIKGHSVQKLLFEHTDTHIEAIALPGPLKMFKSYNLQLTQETSSPSSKMNWSRLQWSILDDPTIRQPGFDLPRCCCALLNDFRTNQGHCASSRKKWGLAATDMPLWQTPNDITYCQQLLRVQAVGGGLQQLHSADDVATEWLKT